MRDKLTTAKKGVLSGQDWLRGGGGQEKVSRHPDHRAWRHNGKGGDTAFVLNGSGAATIAEPILRAMTQTHPVRASAPGSQASALPPLATLLCQLQVWCLPLPLGELCFSIGRSPGLQRPAICLNPWAL